jgi:hypothetical protein
LRKLWPHLNPYYRHIWHNKNCQKRIKTEKVTIPQCRGGQELKKQTTKHYKAWT